MKAYAEDEKNNIKKLMNTTKNTVMQRKYWVLHLHMQGYLNKEIAEMTGLNVQTVGIYIKNYVNSGVDGLIPKLSSGRPRFLTTEQEQLLHEVISTRTPDEVGFDDFKNWTSNIACQWVYKEFGVNYSINGMLDLFRRMGLIYTRPTYVLAKADTEKQEQFKEDFKAVKKNYWTEKK